MRILTTHRPGGAYAYISDGWLNALRAAGHVAERWDGSQASWDSFQPDLYIGCSGHRQPIPAHHPHTKLAIHVNPYGQINLDGINENQAAINWTISQKPDVVFGYGHESDRHYWSYWTDRHGIPWVPMPTAGDATLYRPGAKRYDVAYVGGYWGYKAKNLDVYLVPLLRKLRAAGGCTVAAFGWGPWPDGTIAGAIEDDKVPAVLGASRIGLCMTEPHTTKWGIDLPERGFKVALSGAVVVHDPVHGLQRYLPSARMASSPEEYAWLVQDLLTMDPVKRQELADRQRREVMSEHTYFDRMATLLGAIHRTDPTGAFGMAVGSLLEAKAAACWRPCVLEDE